ncbi:peptidoglycan-binding protein [Anabaena sphaerica FACHB-251]|uniref:Peptidoglycan-binding protein n=1 Tax=Anabaena sphaerica FACHB-251 TaxID=2692883 RepID=A0A927A2E0_9NOST|nr:peptidoglycan-binding protein [Anabaena sphaerica FACHB-251]
MFGSETLTRLKSYQAKKGLIVDGIAGRETFSNLALSSLSKNLKEQDLEIEIGLGEPEQYGKLQLINDTPYMAIVLLYESGNKYSSKYAHIPACSKRTLLNTYSSSWEISYNDSRKFSLGDKADKKNDVFEVKLSQLKEEDTQLCEYDNLAASKLKAVNVSLNPINEILMFPRKLDIDTVFKRDFNKLIGNFEGQFEELGEKALKKSKDVLKTLKEEILKFRSYLSGEDIKLLYTTSEDIVQRTDAFVARYIAKDGAINNENKFLYIEAAIELRKIVEAGELDLDSSDVLKKIRNVLAELQEKCPEIQIDVELSDKLIMSMIDYFKTNKNISYKLISLLPKDSPNQSSSILKNAKSLRSMSSWCQWLKSQHPILFYTRNQSQTIPKKCI